MNLDQICVGMAQAYVALDELIGSWVLSLAATGGGPAFSNSKCLVLNCAHNTQDKSNYAKTHVRQSLGSRRVK